jgi:hypothetical protein
MEGAAGGGTAGGSRRKPMATITISRKLRAALREIRSGWTEQQQIAAARGVKRSSSSVVPPRKGRERKGGV